MEPLTRVQQLIRLALCAGAAENEARNAAFKAVQMIDDFKLLDQTASARPRRERRGQAPPQPSPRHQPAPPPPPPEPVPPNDERLGLEFLAEAKARVFVDWLYKRKRESKLAENQFFALSDMLVYAVTHKEIKQHDMWEFEYLLKDALNRYVDQGVLARKRIKAGIGFTLSPHTGGFG